MYLTRLKFDVYDAGYMLADCQKMHQMLCAAFGTSRENGKLLYRTIVAHGNVYIYVYSDTAVNKQALPSGAVVQDRNITEWLDSFRDGQIIGFDLAAEPHSKTNGKKKSLRSDVERLAWLRRKGTHGGFEILSATEVQRMLIKGAHKAGRGGDMMLPGYQYRGTLRITNAAQFKETLVNGIGSGRAYGYGMMMVM